MSKLADGARAEQEPGAFGEVRPRSTCTTGPHQRTRGRTGGGPAGCLHPGEAGPGTATWAAAEGDPV